MAGLVPAIHVLLYDGPRRKTWMPAQASLRNLAKLGCKRRHDDRELKSDTRILSSMMNHPSSTHALAALWRDAGLPAGCLNSVDLPGSEPALPSSFAVGTAAQ